MRARRGCRRGPAALARAALLALATAALAAAALAAAASPMAAGVAGEPAAPSRARISLAGGAPATAPIAVRVWPDTVAIGDPVLIALDFPAGAAVGRDARLSADAEWLVWRSGPGTGSGRSLAAGGRGRAGDRTGGRGTAASREGGRDGRAAAPPWPAPAGSRVTGVAYVSQLGALELAAGSGEEPPTAALVVRETVAAGEAPSRERDPRGLGWRGDRLALLAALIVLAITAARWRPRRRRAARPQDAPLAPPAYLAAAIALRDLQATGWPERGEGKRFLDALAARLRAFAAERYRIAADAMAPPEVAARLTALKYPCRDAQRLAACLDACDRGRYAPEPVGPRDCAALLAEAVAVVAAGRVAARFTPVPEALAREGEAAWRQLAADARGAGAETAARAPAGSREA